GPYRKSRVREESDMGKLIFAFILIALGFVALRILQNIANHLAPREQDMAAKLRLAGRGALAGGLMLASLIVLVGSIFVINAGHGRRAGGAGSAGGARGALQRVLDSAPTDEA